LNDLKRLKNLLVYFVVIVFIKLLGRDVNNFNIR